MPGTRRRRAKDAKALDTLLASTLVYIDYDGTMMDKARFMTV
jgi:hypothetical protein